MKPRIPLILLISGCFAPVDVGTHSRSALCSVGQDQTCNADPLLSAVAGECQLDAGVPECLCRGGYVREGATGRCAVPPSPICTVGIAMSCNDGPVGGGVGGTAGQCLQGAAGPECTCNAGFERNPATGRCRTTAPSCGANTCGACQPGCTARDVCTATGWQCTCDCPGLCTPGVASSCDEGLLDAGAGVSAGQCVVGQSGLQCICNPGFQRTTSGHCAPTATTICTTPQSCNTIPGMSALAGVCVPNGGGGTACVCNAHFQYDEAGRCAPSLCVETQGSLCRLVNSDGTTPTTGMCGTLPASASCACGRSSAGTYQPYCGGACIPNDGGFTRQCFPANCGTIHCMPGETTCTSYGRCE